MSAYKDRLSLSLSLSLSLPPYLSNYLSPLHFFKAKKSGKNKVWGKKFRAENENKNYWVLGMLKPKF